MNWKAAGGRALSALRRQFLTRPSSFAFSVAKLPGEELEKASFWKKVAATPAIFGARYSRYFRFFDEFSVKKARETAKEAVKDLEGSERGEMYYNIMSGKINSALGSSLTEKSTRLFGLANKYLSGNLKYSEFAKGVGSEMWGSFTGGGNWKIGLKNTAKLGGYAALPIMAHAIFSDDDIRVNRGYRKMRVAGYVDDGIAYDSYAQIQRRHRIANALDVIGEAVSRVPVPVNGQYATIPTNRGY